MKLPSFLKKSLKSIQRKSNLSLFEKYVYNRNGGKGGNIKRLNIWQLKEKFRQFPDFLKTTIWHDTLSFGFTKQTITIFILVFIVLFFNLSKAHALADEKALLEVGDEKSVRVIENLNQYTPFLNEDTEGLTNVLAGESGEYITKPQISETVESPYIYTVREKETLTQIAAKFNLHVATIIEANDLKTEDIEKLRPGTVLTIPPYDTSTSLAWLDEINRVKAEEEAKARAEAEKKKRQQAKLALQSGKQTAASGYSGAAGSNFIVPIISKGITRGIGRGHTGIDYRADVGTKVVASQTGRVIEITSGWAGGWGNSVVLDHGNGITTRYAHLSRIAVSIGQTIGQSDTVGSSGSTGFSTGPHLHFEARRNGSVIYPF